MDDNTKVAIWNDDGTFDNVCTWREFINVNIFTHDEISDMMRVIMWNKDETAFPIGGDDAPEQWIRLFDYNAAMVALCHEYQSWIDLHSYPAMSADELACELHIVTNPQHRAWLANFIARWEKVENNH